MSGDLTPIEPPKPSAAKARAKKPSVKTGKKRGRGRPLKYPKPEVKVEASSVDELLGFFKAEEYSETVVLEDKLETILEKYTDEDVLWKPFPGPQVAFLQADETEVLFSGGRASGKSQALLIDLTRYVNNPNFRGLIVRKSLKAFRNLIRTAKRLYIKGIPGTVYKEMEKMFIFPSGASLEFGYCEREDDVEQYVGQEYQYLGIDEITQYEEDWIIELLKPSLRSGDPTLPIRIRATTNPTGPGRGWVRERFNIKFGPEGNDNQTQTKTLSFKLRDGSSREVASTLKWIHSTIEDNPVMLRDDEYIATLANIKNENLRKQWLEGSWDSADGMAFSEFNRSSHTCKPFNVPRGWRKFRACDWGFSGKPYAASMLWFAVDPEGTVYLYREYNVRQQLVKDFAIHCKDLERGEGVQVGYIDVSAFSNRGEMGESPADTMLAMGLSMVPSDRTAHRRKRDKLLVHQILSINEVTGKPGLIIFNTCVNTIEELLNLPLDPKDNEDIDTTARDHNYDSLRYFLQSRPLTNSYNVFGDSYNYNNDRPTIVCTKFGY